jgi:transposase InsO family protein
VFERHGIRSSLSQPGNCWDNQVANSVVSTSKIDLPVVSDPPGEMRVL